MISCMVLLVWITFWELRDPSWRYAGYTMADEHAPLDWTSQVGNVHEMVPDNSLSRPEILVETGAMLYVV